MIFLLLVVLCNIKLFVNSSSFVGLLPNSANTSIRSDTANSITPKRVEFLKCLFSCFIVYNVIDKLVIIDIINAYIFIIIVKSPAFIRFNKFNIISAGINISSNDIIVVIKYKIINPISIFYLL